MLLLKRADFSLVGHMVLIMSAFLSFLGIDTSIGAAHE
jgi:hypothetical protein